MSGGINVLAGEELRSSQVGEWTIFDAATRGSAAGDGHRMAESCVSVRAPRRRPTAKEYRPLRIAAMPFARRIQAMWPRPPTRIIGSMRHCAKQ